MSTSVSQKLECGECTACCNVVGVTELNKPGFRTCEHVVLGKGCAIYNCCSRPRACSEFRCLWLQGVIDEGIRGKSELRFSFRPDKCGIVFSVMGGSVFGKQLLVAYEVYPGAFLRGLGRLLLDHLSHNSLVLLLSKAERRFIGPPEQLVRVRDIMKREAGQMEKTSVSNNQGPS